MAMTLAGRVPRALSRVKVGQVGPLSLRCLIKEPVKLFQGSGDLLPMLIRKVLPRRNRPHPAQPSTPSDTAAGTKLGNGSDLAAVSSLRQIRAQLRAQCQRCRRCSASN